MLRWEITLLLDVINIRYWLGVCVFAEKLSTNIDLSAMTNMFVSSNFLSSIIFVIHAHSIIEALFLVHQLDSYIAYFFTKQTTVSFVCMWFSRASKAILSSTHMQFFFCRRSKPIAFNDARVLMWYRLFSTIFIPCFDPGRSCFTRILWTIDSKSEQRPPPMMVVCLEDDWGCDAVDWSCFGWRTLTHKPVITVAIVMMAGDSKVTMPNARKGECGSMIGRTLLGVVLYEGVVPCYGAVIILYGYGVLCEPAKMRAT